MSKIKVAVIFGGTNTEHEVSLVSAKAVIDNLDKQKFEIIPIKITKENTWNSPKSFEVDYKPRPGKRIVDASYAVATISKILSDKSIDVVFPVLHGPYGEDGTIQGLLELLRVPYVGCGVAGSAVCMDKVIQKNICRDYGIPITQFFWLSQGHWQDKKQEVLKLIDDQLGEYYPLFVKPANQGSSVGITKAHNKKELVKGIKQALAHDTKVIIERGVENVREIECSVLGTNHSPETSELGEIIPGHEYYDYESKYIDKGSRAIIPVNLDQELVRKIRHTARLAFEILDCYGLARVDFLIDSTTGKFYLNELNTMPGFTPISMYPKLWEASGLSFKNLLTRLVNLALERQLTKSHLKLSL